MELGTGGSRGRTVVRSAVAADVPQMVMIGKRFFEETGYTRLGIHANPHKLHDSLVKAIESEDYGVFVAERDGRVVGVASAARYTMYFSDAPVGMELFWWIDPGLRGGSAAVRLLNELEAWAKQAGCQTFSMIDIPGIAHSPASKIYERRGYELVERTWIRRIE